MIELTLPQEPPESNCSGLLFMSSIIISRATNPVPIQIGLISFFLFYSPYGSPVSQISYNISFSEFSVLR